MTPLTGIFREPTGPKPFRPVSSGSDNDEPSMTTYTYGHFFAHSAVVAKTLSATAFALASRLSRKSYAPSRSLALSNTAETLPDGLCAAPAAIAKSRRVRRTSPRTTRPNSSRAHDCAVAVFMPRQQLSSSINSEISTRMETVVRPRRQKKRLAESRAAHAIGAGAQAKDQRGGR